MDRPTGPRSHRRRGVGRALVAGSAALLAVTSLTSCRADQVGTAAIIGGESISVDELQDATQRYLDAVPAGDSGDAQQAILQQRIVSAVIERAAETAGVDVTDAEVAAQRDQVLDTVSEQARDAEVSARVFVVRQLAAGEQPAVVPPDEIERFIRDQLLATKIGEDDPAAINEALVTASRDVDIEVNPRYGHWDAEQGFSLLISGGLSRTVDELSGNADQEQ